MMLTLTEWTPERIPISHQLPPMPHEGCLQIPKECESGWEQLPRAVEPEAEEPEIEEKPKIKESECLIKKKDILAYFKGNDKTGYTCHPPWMKLFEIYTPPSCPKPPIDKKIAATIERLTKNIQKSYVQHLPANKNHRQCDAYIGSRTKDYKYECVATDEHRAILVRRNDKQKKVNGVSSWRLWSVNEVPSPGEPSLTLTDPDIFVAIKRLSTLLDTKYWFIVLNWNDSGKLIISAENSFKEEGVEEFSCKATYSGRIALDPRYVLPALGTWPLVMYQKEKKSPAIFMPDTKQREFMYVLMPMQL
jgi:hypothetical protein